MSASDAGRRQTHLLIEMHGGWGTACNSPMKDVEYTTDAAEVTCTACQGRRQTCTCGCGQPTSADYWHAWQVGRARGYSEQRRGAGEQRRGWLTRQARRPQQWKAYMNGEAKRRG